MSRQRSMAVITFDEHVTIGELVRLTGSRYSTLKYYTEEGLLPFEQPEENLTRRYKREETIERIRLIKNMKATGATIAEIKEKLGVDGIMVDGIMVDGIMASFIS